MVMTRCSTAAGDLGGVHHNQLFIAQLQENTSRLEHALDSGVTLLIIKTSPYYLAGVDVVSARHVMLARMAKSEKRN